MSILIEKENLAKEENLVFTARNSKRCGPGAGGLLSSTIINYHHNQIRPAEAINHQVESIDMIIKESSATTLLPTQLLWI